jgi:hypothetical protein
MIPPTVPEVRRLVLAMAEPEGRRRFLMGWSAWRRAHQAVAARCRAAKRAARHALRDVGRVPRRGRLGYRLDRLLRLLANFANYGVTYGSLGAAVGLLVYFYLSASIVLAGAEVNAAIYYLPTEKDTQAEEYDLDHGSQNGLDRRIGGI